MTKKHNGSQRVFGRRDRRDIPLENDAMFAEVMRRKDLCIGLLETIFEGRRIRDIVYEDGLSPEAQKYIAFNPGNKSIRLDVYFEDGDLPLGDGRCIMFLNTKGSIGELGEDMDAFFGYINGGVSSIGTGKDSGNEFVERLDECVLDINGDEDWRQGYMKYELNLIEKYKDGEAKGISIGEANATNRMVKAMHSKGIPVQTIAECASIDANEVQRIIDCR